MRRFRTASAALAGWWAIAIALTGLTPVPAGSAEGPWVWIEYGERSDEIAINAAGVANPRVEENIELGFVVTIVGHVGIDETQTGPRRWNRELRWEIQYDVWADRYTVRFRAGMAATQTRTVDDWREGLTDRVRIPRLIRDTAVDRPLVLLARLQVDPDKPGVEPPAPKRSPFDFIAVLVSLFMDNVEEESPQVTWRTDYNPRRGVQGGRFNEN